MDVDQSHSGTACDEPLRLRVISEVAFKDLLFRGPGDLFVAAANPAVDVVRLQVDENLGAGTEVSPVDDDAVENVVDIDIVDTEGE